MLKFMLSEMKNTLIGMFTVSTLETAHAEVEDILQNIREDVARKL